MQGTVWIFCWIFCWVYFCSDICWDCTICSSKTTKQCKGRKTFFNDQKKIKLNFGLNSPFSGSLNSITKTHLSVPESLPLYYRWKKTSNESLKEVFLKFSKTATLQVNMFDEVLLFNSIQSLFRRFYLHVWFIIRSIFASSKVKQTKWTLNGVFHKKYLWSGGACEFRKFSVPTSSNAISSFGDSKSSVCPGFRILGVEMYWF